MASLVDLCNLSLSRLGDEATVVSIDPPDGSAQATYCARFLPMTRDSLLTSHAWGFALRREPLAARVLPAGVSTWAYAYALPTQCLTVLGVQAADADDDILAFTATEAEALTSGIGTPYSVELDPDGARVLYTDQASAVLRYVKRVEDPTLWSPLFTDALSWRLAAAVAGPLLKGQSGMQQAMRCEQAAAAMLSAAKSHDANQQRSRMQQMPPAASWLAAR